MSSEKPSETNRMRKIAGSFKGKLSSLLHLSRAPTPSSIEMDLSSDNPTIIPAFNVVPVVSVDHAPSTAFTTEAYALSSGAQMLVPRQLSSTSGRGLETPPMHMSTVSRSPSPSSPDSAATKLERNPSVSGSGIFANAQNMIINGGTFINDNTGKSQGKSFSPLHSSRAPTLSSIEMDSSSRVSSLNVVPEGRVDHSPTAVFATGACTLSPGPSISMPVPKQLGSGCGQGLETPSTHMSAVSRSPLLPSSTDPIVQGATELEQNSSTQASGSGMFANAQYMIINGGTFINDNTQMKIPVIRRPNPSPLFVGRKDVLDRLRKIFIHPTDSKLMLRCSCLLWGTGGIGKTQISLKFVEEMSGRLSHVFWVDAASEESITMSLRGISAAQASCLDDSVESVLQWMSSIQEEWLIVFDNTDNLPVYVVERFIPAGNRGNILITSRNRSMGRVVSSENIIEINEMEEADAITLLLKASCLDASAAQIEVAKDLVTELGCMPLAVDQAGAYIEARRCSFDKYLQHFSLHRQTLMSDSTFKGASNYDRTVYGTWDLSFEEIKKRGAIGQSNAAHAAILILCICAFYHHSNISKDIFRSAAEESGKYVVDSEVAEKLPLAMPSLDCTLLALDNNGHWDDFTFEQGIAVLLSFSLMKVDQSSEMMSVHPLVHSWSRERMTKSKQQEMYEMGSIILCCGISERLSSYDFGLRRLIFPHIKANESYGSQMGLTKKYYDDKWNNFIFVAREIGDWKHAEQLGVQVLDMRKKILDAEHPYTLESMANLATTYACGGKWNEAEQLEVQVLDLRKKLLGAEHPDTLLSMSNLGATYADKGWWNEAEQLEVQVLEMRKKILGAEHPDTLLSMGNLARTYADQGKWNEAEQLEVQVFDMRKKLLGAEHPDTLLIMSNLAATYSQKGRWSEAEQLHVQALDMKNKLLGVEHPDTLLSMGYLANIYADQGKLNEAEQLEVQVLDMRKKLLGVEHPDTLKSMANLARIYSDKGMWNKAEQLEVEVLDMRKKVLGAEHPGTLKGMANLARTYAGQGKWNEAEQLEVQVLDMRKKLLGAEHPDTLLSMGYLARTYADQGKKDEAEQLEVQVLDMRKKLLGVEHPDTLTNMANLARIYSDKGMWNKAEQLDVEVLDMRKKVLGAEHPGTLKGMANLARTYAGQEKWNEAEQLEVQVLDMRKKLLGAEHPDTLKSMANLARIRECGIKQSS